MGNVTLSSKRIDWREWFVYIVLVALIIGFSLMSKAFLTTQNFEGIGRQIAMVTIVALGATFVITAGHIDLSVGSLVGLVGLVAAICMRSGLGIFLSSLVGLAIGAGFGVAHGLLVTKAKIPAFLVTLGTMGIARGLALTITNTKAVIILNDKFTTVWGAGALGRIPVSVVWMAALFAVAIWLYHFTTFGNYVKAIGGNPTAARYSGIKVDKNTMMVFIYAGLMAAVAGLIMAARLKSGRPEVGSGMEMDAIAAVILGGASLFGGSGKMVNTFIGALIMGIIVNGLILMGVQSNIQEIVKGAIIIAAVSLGKRNQ
ncbi:MAG: ABC transporter permease [Clostridiales Family XIII bacterium]|jgi:ribose transport system permease protein|nr:ABC transporter permease [Clostridiales Family XIII bacterium]